MINEEYSPAAKQAFDKVKQGMLGNVSKLFDKYKNPDAIIYGRARKELKKVQDMENTNKLKEAIKKALTKENSTQTKTQTYKGVTYDSSEGSPFDRGSSDRYYGLKFPTPHKIEHMQGGGAKRIPEENLTPEEIEAYMAGYEGEPERKDWLEEKAEFPDLTGDGKVTRADILKGRGVELEEDLDLGHEDDEPHMIKAELYKIGKYAMELYQMVDQFEGPGEVDFPAWWQSKITNAASMISSAKHYLEFELKEPEVDAAIDALTGEEYYEDEPMMEGEIGEDERLASRLYKIKNNVQPAFYQKVRRMINNGELEKAEELIKRMEPVATEKDTEFFAMKSQLDSLSEIKAKVLEKLTAKTPMKTYIKDFAKSDALQFKGKTKEKKRQMAVAAKLSKEK